MFRFATWTLRAAVLSAALLIGSSGTAFAQHHGGGGHGGGAVHGGAVHGGAVHGGAVHSGYHGGGGYHGGYYHGGGYNSGYYHGGYGGYHGYGYRGYGYGYYPGIYLSLGGWPYYGGYGYGSYGYSSYPSYGSYPYYSDYSAYYSPSMTYTPSYAPDYSTPAYNYAPPADTTTATVTIHVPPDAQVWFDDSLTRQNGEMRTFVTPPLESGKVFHYNVRARWMNGNTPVDTTRSVEVRAGQRTDVDFMRSQ
jgi:uncharacterized protein (TIGR03000 family)